MKSIIYADNAATTKLDKDALTAMVLWLTEEYGNPSQPYSIARKPKLAISQARAAIAKCINADEDEIFFTSGGTEGDNFILKGVGERLGHVVISEIEHHAVLNPCKTIEKTGVQINYLSPSTEGYIDAESLDQALNSNAGLVSVMFANNEIGTIQPIKELCERAHAKGWLFHTDAVQAVGHIEIDVKDLGVDFLTASAHKFNGPKGIGFVYIKKGTPIYPLLEGGSQEKGVRAGTENVASIVGMATALTNNCKNIQSSRKHLKYLENIFLDELIEHGIDFIVNGGENKLPGLISISFKESDGEMLLHRLDLMGIMVSTGAACDSKTTQISHVLRAIKLDSKYAKGTIRISLGKYNSVEDVHKIALSIVKILK